jgi:hypothetical protein
MPLQPLFRSKDTVGNPAAPLGFSPVLPANACNSIDKPFKQKGLIIVVPGKLKPQDRLRGRFKVRGHQGCFTLGCLTDHQDVPLLKIFVQKVKQPLPFHCIENMGGRVWGGH